MHWVRFPSLVCLSRCILSKRIKVFFSPSGRHIILVVYTEHYGNIPMGTPLTGAKIVILDQCLPLARASITAGPSCVVNILTVVIALMRRPSPAINKRRSAVHQRILFMIENRDVYAEDRT